MKTAFLEIAPKPLNAREDSDQFASLYHLYSIVNTDLVASFIQGYPNFTGILFETHRQIKRIFRENIVKVCLEYVRDPEEDFEGLFVIIKTNLSPKESLDLLDRFNEEWFLDNVSDEIGSIFTVTVRPV